MAIFIYLFEDKNLEKYPVNKEDTTVGRSSKADIKVIDPKCSGIHFRFFLEEKKTIVVDNASTNGVYFKDKKLLRHHLLINQILEVGELKIFLSSHDLDKQERRSHINTRNEPDVLSEINKIIDIYGTEQDKSSNKISTKKLTLERKKPVVKEEKKVEREDPEAFTKKTLVSKENHLEINKNFQEKKRQALHGPVKDSTKIKKIRRAKNATTIGRKIKDLLYNALKNKKD